MAITGASVLPARANTWPNGPIRIIVSQGSGAGADLTARALGEYITATVGVPVIVEARPGAGGLLASEAVARAAPDGQTLLLGAYSQYTQATTLLKKPIIDPVKTLAPVALLGVGAGPLLVRKDFPANNLREYLEVARTRGVSFGSYSLGSMAHLMLAQLAQDTRSTNTRIDIIPYKGSAPMLTDLAAGHIDSGIATLASARAFLQQDRVRSILVITNKRSRSMPGLSTWAEEGFTSPVYDLKEYYLAAMPIATPPEIRARIGKLIHDSALHNDRVKAIRATNFEEEPVIIGEALDKMVQATLPVWQASTRALGVTID